MNCVKLVIESKEKFLEDLKSIDPIMVEEVDIKDGIEDLEGLNFEKLSLVLRVRLPEGLKKIPDHYFTPFRYLSEINLPDSIVEIGEKAFLGCKELKIDALPKNLKKIGKMALLDVYPCDFILPDGIEVIGDLAFGKGWYPKEMFIPPSLKKIGDSAFYLGRAIRKIFIPKTVTKLGPNFYNKMRTRIEMEENHPYFEVKSDGIYSKDGSILYMMTLSDSNLDYQLEEGVKAIKAQAFRNCKLKSIRLHEGIRELPEGMFKNTKIEVLILPDSIERIGEEAFCYAKIKHLKLPNKLKRIEKGLFKKSNIEKFFLPEGIEEIGEEAFFEAILSKINLPSSLKKIEAMAFFGIRKFYSIVLPDNVESLGKHCFSKCEHLKKVLLLKKLKEIGEYCFYECYNLKELSLPEGLLEIGSRAFTYSGIRELSLPKSVRTVGDGTFDEMSSLALYDKVRYETKIHTCEGMMFCFTMSPYPTNRSIFLTLKSEKTDEIIYKLYYVPIREERKEERGFTIVNIKSAFLFNENQHFDFESYDGMFMEIAKPEERLKFVLSRLKYPYELSEEAEKKYVDYLEFLQDDETIVPDLVMREITENGMDGIRVFFKYKILGGRSLEKVIERLIETERELEVMELVRMKEESDGGEW